MYFKVLLNSITIDDDNLSAHFLASSNGHFSPVPTASTGIIRRVQLIMDPRTGTVTVMNKLKLHWASRSCEQAGLLISMQIF